MKSQNFILRDELIYNICSLKLDNFKIEDLKNLDNRSLLPSLSIYYESQLKENKFDSPSINVSLFNVMKETDIVSLTTPSRLKQLFDFYPDFSEKHAAIFVLSISSPYCEIEKYFKKLEIHQKTAIFNIYKEIFIEKKIDFTKMIDYLDQPDFKKYPIDSIHLVFSCLCCFFDKQLIPSEAFTRKWKNEELQLSFLSAITQINIPNLDFSKGTNLVNIHQFDMQPNTFALSNNCWLSYDFAERIISLIKNDKQTLEYHLKQLENKYPALLLSLLGQKNIEKTELIKSLSLNRFIFILQGPQTIINVLWQTCESFMEELTLELYKKYPGKIELIYETSQERLNTLFYLPDVSFATDLAFYSCSKNETKYKIKDFIINYTNKWSVSSIIKIIDFIKNRISETLPSAPSLQTSVLDSFFEYLSSNFENYPPQIKAFIQRTFRACEAIKPDLKHFTFELIISNEKLREMKNISAVAYSKFLDDEISAKEFSERIQEYRTTDPYLFSCMIHYLLAEFEYIERHSIQSIQKLSYLTGSLVNLRLLSPKQLDYIFKFVKNSLSNLPNSGSFSFACNVIHASLPSLRNYPHFVFDLIHASHFRENNLPLFDKVQKISQLLNEPIKTSNAIVLKINPILKRFQTLNSPPPRVCKAVQEIKDDPSQLPALLSAFPAYHEWIANHIVSIVQDFPQFLKTLKEPLFKTEKFLNLVFQAAASQTYQHIQAPNFEKYEGSFLHRRLLILGQLIGQITLAVNRPILSKFLDLKQILLHGYSQGKLYGIVPFVCAIFNVSSSYFYPPNPYTSSILQVLAAIYSTDSIKLLIKNHISNLFERMGVSYKKFTAIPILFPAKTQNNYDYILPYFSLQCSISPPDIDRIINFDENALGQFINQYIIVPEITNYDYKPEIKDKIKMILVQKAITLIRNEGTKLSNIVSSTASTLILKDFMLFHDADDSTISEMASTLTNQLSSGITIISSNIEIPRQFSSSLKDSDKLDQQIIESVIELNYSWIEQLLRDIVKIRSWKAVQKDIEHADEFRQQNGIYPTIVNNYSHALKQEFYNQMRHVYADLSELFLTMQPYPKIEPNQDKQVQSDQEFDNYLLQFYNLFPYDMNSNEQSNEAIEAFLNKSPDLSGKSITYERFISILKSLYKAVVKNLSCSHEMIICKLLEKIARCVPNSYIIKSKSYSITWIKSVIRSPVIINQLLVLGLISTTKLDQLFTELLNADPFNSKNVTFITNVINYLIDDGKGTIQPENILSTLGGLNACCQIFLKEQNQFSTIINHNNAYGNAYNNTCNYFKKLVDLYNEMEAPYHQLSTSSKLQTVSTFDPIEEIKELNEIENTLQNWKEVLNSQTFNEEELLKLTHQCIQKGKNFFVYLFFGQNEQTIYQFLQCIFQAEVLTMVWNNILDSLLYIVKGNANVVNYDMRKYYFIFRLLMEKCVEDQELLPKYAVTLHQIRPLIIPNFTYSWIELITDKQFVYILLINQNYWASYSVLLVDFAVIISRINNVSSPEIFNQCYRSFLRFLLILVHDFRDFIFSISPMLLSSIPFQFTQIRNIILSITPTSNDVQSLYTNDEISKFLPSNFVNMVSQLISNNSFDENILKTLIYKMDSSQENSISLIRYFVNVITSSISSLKLSDSVEETLPFLIITKCFKITSPEMATTIINLLIDRLRYDCRETNSFVRFIISLFKYDLNQTNSICYYELIARLIFERASTPAPHPYGIISIIKKMLTDNDKQNNIWSIPLVKNNELLVNFLNAIKSTFITKK